MKTWLSDKVKKRLPSPIDGLGMFAVAPISRDSIVAVKAGHIIDSALLEALPFTGHPDLQIADDLFVCPITPRERDKSMLYINHSCEPNVGMRGDIVFVAMRDIDAGEELVIDYAMFASRDYEMICNCKTKKCRKIIKGRSDYKLQKIKKYKKYLSSHIKSKLEI